MKTNAIWICLLLAAGTGAAAEVVAELGWAGLAAEGRLPAGATLAEAADGSRSALELEHLAGGPLSVHLLTVDASGVATLRWAIEGTIRYRDVVGSGYLEMWSFFGGGGHYFSRTLAGYGPMAALAGSSRWRRFVVPFSSEPGVGTPERLELNLVLPGNGTVTIGPVRLVQYGADEDPLAVAGGWWGDLQGGLVGGVGGATLGVLGAVAGVLVGIGRGRRLVGAILTGFVVLGVGALGLCLAALVKDQPSAVWYPLGMIGVVATLVGAVTRRAVARRFADLEERRMRAMDMG